MHPYRAIYAVTVSLLLIAVFAGCGGSSKEPAPQPAATSTITAVPTASAELIALQRQYDDLQNAQVAIFSVWEALASGEQVQCGNYPAYPVPETISAGDAPALDILATFLRSAAIDVDQAVSLWRAECMNPRATTPPDVIDRGRLAARSAGDSLREAAKLLAPYQP